MYKRGVSVAPSSGHSLRHRELRRKGCATAPRIQPSNMDHRCRRRVWLRDRRGPRIPRSEAGVVEGWHGPRACHVDLCIDAVASPFRDALEHTDRYLNGECLYLQSHLAVRYRQRRADELSDDCGAQFCSIWNRAHPFFSSPWRSGCGASCRTADYGAIRYRAVIFGDAVFSFRCHGHWERDPPDRDRHFCPPRSCAG